jgi:integrase
LSYETTRRLALSIIGADTLISKLSRAACREFMDTLRFIPKSTSKRYPDLTPREAAERAQREGWTDLISPANANTYLNKVCVVLNWAVQEEFLAKNHLRGLRLADPVAKREKRMPFSDDQLRRIFSAPLYRGCQDDGHGYAMAGPNRPKGTRFWIPLLGLHTGMRLNEACQLDVTDVREIDCILCFVLTETSLIGNTDKSLKTRSSERIVPVHPKLLQLGFEEFVASRHSRPDGKLFGDICPGRDGFRSTAFSKWFAQFLVSAKASAPRTSYHSFRHTFRDALRQARVERDISLALGGWGVGKSGGDVSDDYGRGYRIGTLFEEISKVKFDIDVAP